MSLPDMDWPTNWAYPSRCEIGLSKQATQHRSEFAGSTQALLTGQELWMMTVHFDAIAVQQSGPREALINMLTGGEQAIKAWHFARPVPIGTMRGAPTLGAAVAQFARAMTIQSTAGATLVMGDMFKVDDLLFQAAETTTADGAGVMLVKTVNRARHALTLGMPVAWDRVTARFVLPDVSSKAVHSRGLMQGTSIALEELP